MCASINFGGVLKAYSLQWILLQIESYSTHYLILTIRLQYNGYFWRLYLKAPAAAGCNCSSFQHIEMCVHARACVCTHARVHACMSACVHACCVCVPVYLLPLNLPLIVHILAHRKPLLSYNFWKVFIQNRKKKWLTLLSVHSMSNVTL